MRHRWLPYHLQALLAERGHFWGYVGICMLAVVAVPTLFIGSIAGLIAGFSVHPLLALGAYIAGMVATIATARALYKLADRFENNHKNQGAYKTFITSEKGTKKANPSLFFSAKEETLTTSSINPSSQNDKQRQLSQ